ncbi:unnamed protein product, partial [Musa textilis]
TEPTRASAAVLLSLPSPSLPRVFSDYRLPTLTYYHIDPLLHSAILGVILLFLGFGFAMGSQQVASLSSINVSAGGLVWVRRRNGSWWPGRTVGLHELPVKCLLPPRSGTPIKLLGREDGSMDWYNLEKSTRVKAFRCGEFDECIQKAMASSVCSNKFSTSTGKYIHREDAILHALEIEKSYFPARKQNGSGMNNFYRATGCDFTKKSKKMHGLDKQRGSMARKFDTFDENSPQGIPQSLVSYERLDKLIAADAQLMEKEHWRTPNDSEGEGINHVRDLQDVGLGIISTRKPHVHVETELFTDLARPDSASLSESNINNSFFSSGPIISCKSSGSCLKQKRSSVAKAHEDVRRDCHHALSKVCKGSRIIIPSYCYWDGTFGGFWHLKEATEKTSKELLSIPSGTNITCGPGTSGETLLGASASTCKFDVTDFNSQIKDCELASMLEFIDNECSDGLVDIPLVMGDHIGEDFQKASEYCPIRDLLPRVDEKQYNGCCHDDLVSHFAEGLGESGFTDSRRQLNSVTKKPEKRTVEPHLISKKNQNYMKFSRITNFAGLARKIGSNHSDEFLTLDSCHSHLVKDESDSEAYDVSQSQSSGNEWEHCQSEALKHCVLNCSTSLLSSRDHERSSRRQICISTLMTRQLFPRDRVSTLTCSEYQVVKQLRSTVLGSSLYDVELTVETKTRRPHVPLNSLMSKLNGKAIVGHPAPIEVMEDGSSDTLITKNDCWPAMSNINRSLKHGGEIIGRATPKKQAAPTYRGFQWGNYDQLNVPSLLKRQHSSNRTSRLSPRKIRRLSPIRVDCKENRKPEVETIVRPAVACVPLGLVFSRITEAFPSSL